MPTPKRDVSKMAAVGRLTGLGYSACDIATQLGITERTVRRHRVALGIAQEPARRLSTEERVRINEMLDDGVPIAEIARTIGRHPDGLWKRYRGVSKATNMADCRKLRKQLGLTGS